MGLLFRISCQLIRFHCSYGDMQCSNIYIIRKLLNKKEGRLEIQNSAFSKYHEEKEDNEVYNRYNYMVAN